MLKCRELEFHYSIFDMDSSLWKSSPYFGFAIYTKTAHRVIAVQVCDATGDQQNY